MGVLVPLVALVDLGSSVALGTLVPLGALVGLVGASVGDLVSWALGPLVGLSLLGPLGL